MLLKKYKTLPYPLNLWSTVLGREITANQLPLDWEKSLTCLFNSLGSPQARTFLQEYYKDNFTWTKIGKNYGYSRQVTRLKAECVIKKLRHPNARLIMIYGLEKAADIQDSKREFSSAPQTAVPGSDALGSRPVSELSLGTRAYNFLRRANISTLGQLIQFTEEELLQLHGMGNTFLQEIKNKLASLNLSLCEPQ